MNTERTAILGGRVQLVQPTDGYRVAVDPLLLAAAVPAAAGETVLDAGSGSGAAALGLAARLADVEVTGLELQAELAGLAERSAAASGLGGRVRFVVGDILDPPADCPPDGFHHVMANPPFMQAGKGRPPPDPVKRTATVEGAARLVDWVGFCISRVRSRGTVTFIHRADRIEHLLAALAGRVGAITLYPLWPGADTAAGGAKRVLVQGRKSAAAPSRVAPGLVLHAADGSFTAATAAVLEDAAALDLATA